MPLDAESLGIDAIAAKSQGATDFAPALLGTLLGAGTILLGLIFAIMIGRLLKEQRCPFCGGEDRRKK
jgi:hypothetical protein